MDTKILIILLFLPILIFLDEKLGNGKGKFWKKVNSGFINISRIENLYEKVLNKILISRALRWQILICVVLFFIFSVSLVPLGFIKNILFPAEQRDQIFVTVETPLGSDIKSTQLESQKVFDTIKNSVPNLNFAVEQTTKGFLDDPDGVNKSLITFNLKQENSKDIAKILRNEIKNYKGNAKVEVKEEEGGPPTGAKLQIKLVGDNLVKLDELAEKTILYLKEKEGLSLLVVTHDEDFAKRLIVDYKLASIPISSFNLENRQDGVLRFCFAKKKETLETAIAILQSI